jgi:CheY-like chemotaxis protein
VPPTLLVADDSATIRRVIELTFADLQIRVVTVGDGEMAIVALETAPPDIVLADILMPGRSGYEVARHIKNTPELSHIPVLLLAGAFEPVDHEMTMALGCAGVLTKPLDPLLVIRRVSELLSAASSARVAASETPAELHEPPRASPDSPEPAAEPVPPLLVVPEPGMTAAPEPATTTAAETEPVPAGPTPVVPVSPVAAPVETEPSVADLVLALPAVPVSASLPPAPRDLEVEAYFEELDQALAHQSRDGRAALHVVEPFPATTGDDVPQPEQPPAAAVPTRVRPAAAPVSLVDAFSALLAAERTAPDRPAPSSRRIAEVRPAPAPASDDLLERIARRAVEHLSEDDLRGVVERVVAETAERLIREEIERIKSNIK